MSTQRNRSAEHTRHKAFCTLHNICIRCSAPKGNNPTVCDRCAQARRDKFKITRQTRLIIGNCACGQELEAGKQACSHCLSKIRKSTKKARTGFLADRKCGTCGGPVINGVTCDACKIRATTSTMNKYHNNISAGVCAHCGAELADHKFRCDICHETHMFNSRARWRRLRQIVLNHYGGACTCCGITKEEFLEVDHINGNGTKHRMTTGSHFYEWIIKHDFPTDLQLLCANCNRGKSKFGICPHQSEPAQTISKTACKARQRRILVITRYGSICRHCGESNWAFLEFDHVNNDGKQHRDKLKGILVNWIICNNFPDNIQLLCSNCNKAKWLTLLPVDNVSS